MCINNNLNNFVILIYAHDFQEERPIPKPGPGGKGKININIKIKFKNTPCHDPQSVIYKVINFCINELQRCSSPFTLLEYVDPMFTTGLMGLLVTSS